jgi:hypothetical protein
MHDVSEPEVTGIELFLSQPEIVAWLEPDAESPAEPVDDKRRLDA